MVLPIEFNDAMVNGSFSFPAIAKKVPVCCCILHQHLAKKCQCTDAFSIFENVTDVPTAELLMMNNISSAIKLKAFLANRSNNRIFKYNSLRRGPTGPSSLAPATEEKMHLF